MLDQRKSGSLKDRVPRQHFDNQGLSTINAAPLGQGSALSASAGVVILNQQQHAALQKRNFPAEQIPVQQRYEIHMSALK